MNDVLVKVSVGYRLVMVIIRGKCLRQVSSSLRILFICSPI